jgi:hypothetical protein
MPLGLYQLNYLLHIGYSYFRLLSFTTEVDIGSMRLFSYFYTCQASQMLIIIQTMDFNQLTPQQNNQIDCSMWQLDGTCLFSSGVLCFAIWSMTSQTEE